jgi:hypothetical protein
MIPRSKKSAVLLAFIAAGVSAAPSPKPVSSSEPAAPAVDFQVLPERDAVQRKETFSIFLVIANKSSTMLKNPKVILLNPGFGLTEQVLSDVPAFGSKQVELKGAAGPLEEFSQHRLTFMLQYSWAAQGKEFTSAQPATMTLQVNHPFEDEAKGLPGGSGALLYLLIPILPVFFAYHIVDSFRQGEGFKIPEFKTEYLLPSFLVALGLNFFLVAILKQDLSTSYSNPLAFAGFMGGSAAAGALIPALGWVYQAAYWSRYAFHENDSYQDYLRKALRLSRSSSFQWVKGKYNGQDWQGFLLHQPDQTCVLGAQLEISTARGGPTYEQLKAVVDRGKIIDRAKLLTLIKTGSVNVQAVSKVMQGDTGLDDKAVVLEGVKSFSPDESGLKPLTTLTN